MTEICALDHLPTITTLYNWRRRDPVFDTLFLEAIEDHLATLISDAMEGAQSVADADHDADSEPVNPADASQPNRAGSAVNRAKSSEFYINSVLKYAGAMAPHKYGTLLKAVSAQIGSGVQITITSYAPDTSTERAPCLSDTGSTAPV